MGRKRRGFLLHLLHNLTPEDLIVDSHCTWSARNLGRNCLILFQEAKYLPQPSDTVLGAKLLEEGHVCLTDTIEGRCTEFW